MWRSMPKGLISASALFLLSSYPFGLAKPEPDTLKETRQAAPVVTVLSTSMKTERHPKATYVTKALEAPKIVLLGDSIVHYSSELVSRRLLQILTEDYGLSASIQSVTKGGQLIKGWIGGNFEKYVTDPKFNIIVLQGGVNDIGWFGRTGKSRPREEQMQKLRSRFDEMVKEAQHNQKVLVLVTVSPWKGQTTWDSTGQEYTEWLNSWMKSQATASGIYAADTYLRLVNKEPACDLERDILTRGYQGVDVQHTNDSGRRAIAEVISDAMGYPAKNLTKPENTKGFSPRCPIKSH